jgi:hypothetical protein
MINPRIASLTVTYLLGLLSLATAACTAEVISGNGGSGSGGSTGTNGQGGQEVSTAPCTNCVGTSAIAVTAAQLFGSSTSSSGQSGVTGSGGPDPSMLYLEIGSPAPTCAVPMPPTACGAETFDVSIGIPAALQQAGMVSLGDPTLLSTFGETTGGPGSGCSGSGGSFTEGTLQIVSIDGQEVQFQLTGTLALGSGFPSVDGTYTAPRCPAP